MYVRRRRAGLELLTLIATGCGPEKEPVSRTVPLLTAVDSVQLEEDDTRFVGEASGFWVASDGAFLISDRRNGVVHVYSRRGHHNGSLGSRGDGPEEWSRGPFFVRAEDSVLAVADGHRFKTLQYPSGRVLKELQRPPGSGFVAFRNGDAYFRSIDRSQKTTFEVVSDDGRVVRGGAFTAAMGRSATLDNMFSFLAIAPLAENRIAIAYQNSDFVYFGPVSGPFDSVAVPVVERRGARLDLLNAIEDGNPQTAQRAAYQPSYPFLLAPTGSDARLAYVTIDQTFEGNRMTGQPFLSLVDINASRACADARVPGPVDPQPWVAVVADTLFVLNQDEGPSGKPRSTIRAFLLDQSHCWGTK